MIATLGGLDGETDRRHGDMPPYRDKVVGRVVPNAPGLDAHCVLRILWIAASCIPCLIRKRLSQSILIQSGGGCGMKFPPG